MAVSLLVFPEYLYRYMYLNHVDLCTFHWRTMDQEGHSPVLLIKVQFYFSQSSFNFPQSSFNFSHSPVLILGRHQFSLYCYAHVLCMLSWRRPFWRTILWWMPLYGKLCAKKWDVQLPLSQKEWLLRKWNRQTRLHDQHFHRQRWTAYLGYWSV